MTRPAISKLRKLFAEIVAEAEANPSFAERLATLFEAQASSPTRRRAGRRAPGVLDPYKLLRELGRDGLKARLSALDVEQLKDIVAEHGMDPARLAMKWRKPERLVDHIISIVTSRERKGDAFRGGTDASEDEPGLDGD